MITTAQIEAVTALLEAQGPVERLVPALRRAFPALHFTWCLDDEVQGPEPVRRLPGCNLYLLEGRGHCLGLTSDPAAATGLVLAGCD
jgi:hypothetical protein